MKARAILELDHYGAVRGSNSQSQSSHLMIMYKIFNSIGMCSDFPRKILKGLSTVQCREIKRTEHLKMRVPRLAAWSQADWGEGFLGRSC